MLLVLAQSWCSGAAAGLRVSTDTQVKRGERTYLVSVLFQVTGQGLGPICWVFASCLPRVGPSPKARAGSQSCS
jgi:hypothetical protein